MYYRRIVCSLSGHDKGRFMVVVGGTDNRFLVCDGKKHPLSRPKTKNPKHLRVTDITLDKEQLNSDKSLRRAIYALMNAYKEETVCQKKI